MPVHTTTAKERGIAEKERSSCGKTLVRFSYKLPNIVSNQFYRATPIILPTTAQPLSTLPPSTIPSYPLQKANYPQVKFWTKKDWLESEEKNAESGSRGKGRLSKGINVRMRYIETAEGLIVDGFKASEMRTFARSIWLSFTELRIAPSKWGQCMIQTRQYYCHEMGARFPELRLSELDWKADHVATQIYSGWYGKWLKRQEVNSDSEESEDVPPAIG